MSSEQNQQSKAQGAYQQAVSPSAMRLVPNANVLTLSSSREQDSAVALFLEAIFDHKKATAYLALIFGGIPLIACLFILPTFYGYTALVQVPDLGNFGPASIKASMGPGSSDLTAPTGFDKDIKSYLEFKYVDRYHSPWSTEPYLKKVEEEKTSRFIRITAYGSTLDVAKDFALQVLDDLKSKYDPMFQGVQQNVKDQMDSLEKQIEVSRSDRKQIDLIIDRLGFGTVYLKQMVDLDTALATMQASYLTLKANTAPGMLLPVTYADLRPVRGSAVSPKTLIFTVAGALFGVMVSGYYFMIQAMLRRRREQQVAYERQVDYEQKAA